MVARHYVDAAAAVGASNGVKDHFGILVSRLNARLFIEALGAFSHSNVRCLLPDAFFAFFFFRFCLVLFRSG